MNEFGHPASVPRLPSLPAWAALRWCGGGALLLALAACGGDSAEGELASVQAGEASSVLLAEADIGAPARAALAEAEALGARKTAFRVGERLGALGETLVQDGWTFQDLPAEGLPTGREAVLYVHKDALSGGGNLLRQRLQSFNGVIVLDTDVRVPTGEALLPAEAGAGIAGQGATASVRAWLQGGDSPQPRASALVIARHAGLAHELEVSSDGAVNGVGASERALTSVNLLLTVAHNLKAGGDAGAEGRSRVLSIDTAQASDANAVIRYTPLSGPPPATVPPAGRTYIFRLISTQPTVEWWSWTIQPRVLTAGERANLRTARTLLSSLNATQINEVVKAVVAERNLNGGGGVTHTGKPAEAVNLLRGGGVARLVEWSRFRAFTDPDVLWLRSLFSANEVGYFTYLKDTHISNARRGWALRDDWFRSFATHHRFITAYREAQQSGQPIPATVRANFERAKAALNPIYDSWEAAADRAVSSSASLQSIHWRMNAIHVNFARSLAREVPAVIQAGALVIEGPPLAIGMPYRIN